MDLISEFKRRNVFRVGAAYLATSWLAIEIAETVFPLFGYGETPARITVIVLSVGFFPALILAWVFEWTPEGIRRDEAIDHDLSGSWQAEKRLDRIIMLILLLAIIVFALDRLVMSDFREASIAESARQKGLAEATQTWAVEEGLPEVEGLVKGEQHIEAYAKAIELSGALPGDRRVARILLDVSETGSLISEPQGADVYYRPYSAPNAEWSHIGKTPLEDITLPRGALVFKFEKAGYSPMHIADLNPGRLLGNMPLVRRGSTVTLIKSVPDDQVLVPGVDYLMDHLTPQETGPYLIDKYEVTNQQFKEFVDAGGYEQPAFWEDLAYFAEEDQRSLEGIIGDLVDTTGRPGPATWELGNYPGGQADWPVSGVSWYEGMAYARFRGRELPTFFHWRRAAATFDMAPAIVSQSNIGGEDAAPVGQYAGIGAFGTYDMAGNVREWVWNQQGSLRMILGGAWNDERYMFTFPNSLPPLDRTATNGFRTVEYLDQGPTEQQLSAQPGFKLDLVGIEPLDDEAYSVMAGSFDYTRSQSRGGEIVASSESPRGWRHDTVLIDSAYVPGGFKVNIYSPIDAETPLQPVIFFPGIFSFRIDTPSESDPLLELPVLRDLDFIIRSGRALIWPVYHGSYERYDDADSLSGPEAENAVRLRVIRWRSDVGEVLDYLETDPDFATGNAALLGWSYGGVYGPMVLALEDRIKAGILIGAGVYPIRRDPLIDNLHYLPRVKQPTLVFSGEYDTVTTPEFAAALYDYLGTPANDKKHVVLPIEHRLPPRSALMEHGVDWLDRYLGPAN